MYAKQTSRRDECPARVDSRGSGRHGSAEKSAFGWKMAQLPIKAKALCHSFLTGSNRTKKETRQHPEGTGGSSAASDHYERCFATVWAAAYFSAIVSSRSVSTLGVSYEFMPPGFDPRQAVQAASIVGCPVEHHMKVS